MDVWRGLEIVVERTHLRVETSPTSAELGVADVTNFHDNMDNDGISMWRPPILGLWKLNIDVVVNRWTKVGN